MLSANRPPVFGTERRYSAFPQTVGGTDDEGQKAPLPRSHLPCACLPSELSYQPQCSTRFLFAVGWESANLGDLRYP